MIVKFVEINKLVLKTNKLALTCLIFFIYKTIINFMHFNIRFWKTMGSNIRNAHKK